MIKPVRLHRIKWYFVGLCFLLVISKPEYPDSSATEKIHVSANPSFAEALSWLRRVGQTVGLSSLECQIHGVSLQLSEILAHLGGFLHPAVRDWRPTGDMVFDLTVAATTSEQSVGAIVNLDVQLKDLTFSSPDATRTGAHIEGKIHIRLNIPGQLDRPTAIQAELDLAAGEISFGKFQFDFKRDPLGLRLLGAYDADNDRFSSLAVHLAAPTLGQGTITATLESLDDPRGEVKVALGPIPNKRAFDLFVREPLGRVSPVLKKLSVNGETSITALIRGSRHRWSMQGLVETSAVDLAAAAYQIEAKGVKIRLPFSAEFPNRGGAPSRNGMKTPGKGLVKIDRIRWKSQTLRNVAVPVAFRENTLLMGPMKLPGWGGAVVLQEARIQDPFRRTREIVAELQLEPLDLARLTRAFAPFSLPGSLEGGFSEIRLSAQRLVTRGNLTIHALGGQIQVSNIQGSVPLPRVRKVSMHTLLRDIHLDEASLGSLLPPPLLNWAFSGAMTLDLAVDLPKAQTRRLNLGAQLNQVSFSSPDETKLGENVQGEIQFDLDVPAHQKKPVSFQGNLDLDAGEMLLGSFYLNLRQDPLRLRSEGVYDSKGHGSSSLSVHFDAPTFGHGTLMATLESLDDLQGEAKVALGPIFNERAFDLFAKEPFGDVSPLLQEISLDGETYITALIRGSRLHWSMQGLVETSAVDLAIPTHQIKAKGIKIQFPFSLNHPDTDRTPPGIGLGHSVTGFVHGDWIQWKTQEWRNITVPLTLMENTLLLPQHLKLPIWGGAVVLEGTEIHDPFGKTMEITLGLRLDGIDLSEVTRAVAPLALPGSLRSNFPEITVSSDGLLTRGNLTIHAFGGQIKVSNIQGSTPFSRLREVSMDVLLSNINLEEVSRSFEFGQMGGVIQGQIRDLSFTFGQPAGFELEIRSVKKRGIKQYVNIEAVNNLSILSTGSPFPFRRGVLQLFKTFPYAKLGIYCKLENDIFTLRGTIHKNGVEYLIRRRGFRGIDVINQNLANRIRWKQMLSRLKAISQGTGGVEVSTEK